MDTSIQKDPRFHILLETSEEFRSLAEEHHDLKKEAAKLSKAKFLTEAEEMKLHELKKRKLEVKDRIMAFLETADV